MNETKAARYQRLRRREWLSGVASGAAILLILVVTSGARRLADLTLTAVSTVPESLRHVAAGALFIAVLIVAWELMTLPVAALLEGRAEKTGSRASSGQAQAMLIALVAAWLTSAIILSAMQLIPRLWWLCAGASLAIALASVMRLSPVLLPALGDVKPLSRRSLMSGLREIARRSGVPVADIVEWRIEDDAPASALVAGAGASRRVFVASHLVRDWSDDEIAVVVAHELAHHVYGDLWRSLALDAAVLSAGLWVAGWSLARLAEPMGLPHVGEIASLPFIALVAAAVWLGSTPVRLAQSRAHERRADRYALKLTGEARAFGAAVRRLSAQHLSEERPSPLARMFFHRHPPVAERLALANSFRPDDRI
jgi:Zn-dependent protease with chaperone function